MLVFISIGAIAVVLVLNLVMTLGLATRLRNLQSDFARGTMRDPSLPRPGDLVGHLDVTTTQGERVTNATLSEGVTLVGIFAPGCPDCARIRSQLLATPPAIPFFAFIDCTGPTLAEEQGRAVADSLTTIAKVALTRQGEPAQLAFRDSGFPTLIRLEGGVVTASGHRLADVLPDLARQAA
jgi:hypothetical protein